MIGIPVFVDIRLALGFVSPKVSFSPESLFPVGLWTDSVRLNPPGTGVSAAAASLGGIR